jgi:hypothetical protein
VHDNTAVDGYGLTYALQPAFNRICCFLDVSVDKFAKFTVSLFSCKDKYGQTDPHFPGQVLVEFQHRHGNKSIVRNLQAKVSVHCFNLPLRGGGLLDPLPLLPLQTTSVGPAGDAKSQETDCFMSRFILMASSSSVRCQREGMVGLATLAANTISLASSVSKAGVARDQVLRLTQRALVQSNDFETKRAAAIMTTVMVTDDTFGPMLRSSLQENNWLASPTTHLHVEDFSGFTQLLRNNIHHRVALVALSLNLTL